MKHCDLKAIQRRLSGPHDVHTIIHCDAPAMAAEIEALRAAIREMGERVSAGEILYGDMLNEVAALVALLQPEEA